ncbi:MAG: hypothetical protein JOY94_14050 [Methylobacteriaceae bacterium]|nr:hypothetical protein [Methylobacteriaceae bacterium]
MQRHRLVTILGPGGIGKTTVAVAVANDVRGAFRDGARFIDLAPLTDPMLVPSAVSAVLGVGVRSENSLRNLALFLQDKEILIVLDSCEHVIQATAELAEGILKETDATHILATSREPLRADGEHVHRLPPLTFPSGPASLGAAQALDFPSIKLFVDRAAASLDTFEFSDADVPLVVDICRRLDGMALAIEIAAGHVGAFGIAGLAARLDDRFRLVMRGRRTALPRHQTLRTTLDWSYTLLPEPERLVLRRLAVFAGFFTMESATAILKDAGTAASDVIDAVANLIGKSLVAASVDRAVAVYRLLDTTRAYALARLEEASERNRLCERHARHFLHLLEEARSEWESRPASRWTEDHRDLIDDVRAALDWAFSAAGDEATGVALTEAAIPLWFQLSLTRECSERVDRALASFAASRSPDSDMRLYAARAWSLMQTRGFVPATEAAWAGVLEIAEQLDSIDYQLRALWGLWADLQNKGEFRAALALAERFSVLAARHTDPTDVLIGDRMVGYTLHILGDQTRSRLLLERMLARYEPPVIGAQTIRYVFDQRAMARCFLARIVWLQGFPDQAMRMVEDIIDAALAGNDMLSLCQALVQAACPVALFVGDLAQADRFVTMLLDHSTRQALDFWHAFGRCFQGVLLTKIGDLDGGLRALRTALEGLRAIQYGLYYGVFLSDFAHALGRAGRTEEGLHAIDAALARSERNEERWYLPELLRVKGELMLRGHRPDAERYFLESLNWARRQETPAWELRTAVSLGALWRDQDRAEEARDLVASAYARFTEGFGTVDLQAAKQLLNELG